MYDILSSRSKDRLLSMVNEREADGWKLVGGHMHVVYEEEMDSYDSEPILRTTGCWSQAMELDADFGYSSIVFRGNIYPENKYELSAVFNITESGDIYFNLVVMLNCVYPTSILNSIACDQHPVVLRIGSDSKPGTSSSYTTCVCPPTSFHPSANLSLTIANSFALLRLESISYILVLLCYLE